MRRTSLFATAGAALFVGLALVGAVEDTAEARVLGWLDPLFDGLRAHLHALYLHLLGRPGDIGRAVSAGLILLAGCGAILGRRAAAPLLLICLSAGLVTWAQVILFDDQVATAVGLYACAAGAALLVAILRPWPRFATEPAYDVRSRLERFATWEWPALFSVTAAALILRLYALNQFPAHFEVEMINSMLHSSTWAGIQVYAREEFFSNSTGIVHMFVQWATAQLVGSSPYSIRLAAVLMGVACVPLFYTLARRIAGAGLAFAGTALYVTAPEQLYWSRSETTVYTAVALLALVSAHVGLWLVARRTWTAALVTALVIPLSRLFYHGGITLFLLPIAAYFHALLFVRGTWRSLHRVVPFILLGLGLWAGSLTLIKGFATGEFGRFINPLIVAGHAPWTQHGTIEESSPLVAVRRQAQSVAINLATVATRLAHRTGFSHWYVRGDPSSRPTLTNVGMVALAAIGIGLLLGQLGDPRAFLLLVWLGLGLLPALLSLDPADRRFAAAFPLLPLLATVALAYVVRTGSECGRVSRWLAAAAVAITVFLIAGTNLASHLIMPVRSLDFARLMRAATPILADSDMVLHDLEEEVVATIAFGNVDLLTSARPPCIAPALHASPSSTLIAPRCDYDSFVHQQMLPPERIESLNREPVRNPRVTFLTGSAERSDPLERIVAALYAGGVRRSFSSASPEFGFRATSVSAEQIREHRTLKVEAPNEPAARNLFAGDVLRIVDVADVPEIRVTGGFLSTEDQWAQLLLWPPCEAAQVFLNGHAQRHGRFEPLAAGPHDFTIRLPVAHECRLPLEFRLQHSTGGTAAPIASEQLLSPATVDALRGVLRPQGVEPGYRLTAHWDDPADGFTARDIGLDGFGRIVLLATHGSACIVLRATEPPDWDPNYRLALPPDFGCTSIAVAADGSVAAFGTTGLVLYDADGIVLRHVPYPYDLTPDAAFTADQRLLVVAPPEGTVVILNEIGEFQPLQIAAPPGQHRFHQPIGVATNRAGDLFVAELDGRVYLYERTGHGFQGPRTAIETQRLSRWSGMAVSERDRLYTTHAESRHPEVYSLDGRRLIAQSREQHLASLTPAVRRFAPRGDRLYVLEQSGTLHALQRLPDHGAVEDRDLVGGFGDDIDGTVRDVDDPIEQAEAP